MLNFAPTPYDDVNAILAELLTAVPPILGDQFIGLYLYGSLAAGDFHPNRSDIDFVVVTAGELDSDTITALATMHAQIRANGSHWAMHLEGDYIPQAALRRYDPAQASYPHLGDDGHFAVEQRGSEVIIQYHILREHGIVVAGPPIRPMIDPIAAEELRRATWDVLFGWWQPMLADPVILASNAYQAYAVLTMCRMLYTFQFGEIVSKPVAARWALNVVDGPFDSAQGRRFIPLIQQANAWQNGLPFDKLDETVEFICYVMRET